LAVGAMTGRGGAAAVVPCVGSCAPEQAASSARAGSSQLRNLEYRVEIKRIRGI